MELVYLWVEDYKNIKNQGFNFSPRFECSYENGVLDICDKKKKECKNNDYLENFFGENINITAIVGENGSGKSNLLESLLCIIEKNGVPWDNYKICAIFYNEITEKFYTKYINHFIHFTKNSLFPDNTVNVKYNTFLLHYNYTLDYIQNKENNINFNSLYHKSDDYKNPILLQPNKANRKINIWLMDYLANKDILNFIIKKKISISQIENFFVPTICKLNFSFSYIYKNKNDFIYSILNRKYKEENISYLTNISNLDKEDLIYLSTVYIIKKTFKNLNLIANKEFYQDIENLNKIIDLVIQGELPITDEIEQFNSIINYIQNNSFENLYYENSHSHKIQKIKDSFEFIKFINSKPVSYTVNSELKIIEHKQLLLVLAPWIDIEFLNEKKISFNDLSYGQKFLIKFLYSLLNQLNNLDSYKEYTNIIILLDEVELGLHPQWQKEYLSLLINTLKPYSNRYKFNIICSSHSPFILSDLPKENVIFLEKYKEEDIEVKNKTQEVGNCKNSTKNIEINPFGANIHTLLSHGFFMQDGLMGEFAKNKINEIIDFLNNKKIIDEISTPQNQIKKVIESIGEDFLKEKLLNMYYKKFNDEFTKKQRIIELLEIQKKIEQELKQYD